jgi:hypothetical protein
MSPTDVACQKVAMAGSVFRRALKDTRDELRLSGTKLVLTVLGAAIGGWLGYYFTGAIAWGGAAAFGGALLLFLPTLAVKYVQTANARIAELEIERDEAKRLLRDQRDQTCVYQRGRIVGSVTGAHINDATGEAFFDRIDGAVAFDTAQPFEFRDSQMRITQIEIDGQASVMGTPIRNLQRVHAQVIGVR